jgi:hypothetical protein
MFVVVLRVLGEDLPQVLFAVDQEVVKALAPQRSHIPLRKRIRPGGPDRSLNDPHTAADEHLVELRRELAVAVRVKSTETQGSPAS